MVIVVMGPTQLVKRHRKHGRKNMIDKHMSVKSVKKGTHVRISVYLHTTDTLIHIHNHEVILKQNKTKENKIKGNRL